MCKVVRATNREPGGGYIDHVKRVTTHFGTDSGVSEIFLLFDDVALPPDFEIKRFIDIARANNLSVASPGIKGSSFPLSMDSQPTGQLQQRYSCKPGSRHTQSSTSTVFDLRDATECAQQCNENPECVHFDFRGEIRIFGHALLSAGQLPCCYCRRPRSPQTRRPAAPHPLLRVFSPTLLSSAPAFQYLMVDGGRCVDSQSKEYNRLETRCSFETCLEVCNGFQPCRGIEFEHDNEDRLSLNCKLVVDNFDGAATTSMVWPNVYRFTQGELKPANVGVGNIAATMWLTPETPGPEVCYRKLHGGEIVASPYPGGGCGPYLFTDTKEDCKKAAESYGRNATSGFARNWPDAPFGCSVIDSLDDDTFLEAAVAAKQPDVVFNPMKDLISAFENITTRTGDGWFRRAICRARGPIVATGTCEVHFPPGREMSPGETDGQGQNCVLAAAHGASLVGRKMGFIEIFSMMFTISAWGCFYDLMNPNANSLGWGYDAWLNKFCLQRDPTFTMGIVDEYEAVHDKPTSVDALDRSTTYSRSLAHVHVERMETEYRERGQPLIASYPDEWFLWQVRANKTTAGVLHGGMYDRVYEPLAADSSATARNCAGFTETTPVSRIVMDFPNAGFGTYVVGVINGLLHADRTGAVPYVDWGWRPGCPQITAEADAKVLARRLGLKLGGDDEAFAGRWAGYPAGLYAYRSGPREGMAYFGLGGTVAAMLAPLADPLYRPVAVQCEPPKVWDRWGHISFHSPSRGHNPFRYYFGSVGRWDPGCPGNVTTVMAYSELHNLADSIQPYYFGAVAEATFDAHRYEHAWYTKNRLMAADVVKRYIRPVATPATIADRLMRLSSAGGANPVLGVQVRASDIYPSFINKSVSRNVGVGPFVPYMTAWTSHHRRAGSSPKIFFASDVPELERWAVKAFPGVVFLYTGALRSNNPNLPAAFIDPKLLGEDAAYKKGLDPLVIALVLSKCDAIVSQESSVSELAFYFNKDLIHNAVNVQYTQNRVEPNWARGATTLYSKDSWLGPPIPTPPYGVTYGVTKMKKRVKQLGNNLPSLT